jgi:hypothetical protein
MKHIPDIRALLRHMNKASDFMRWLRVEGDSLVAAAERLGGRKWATRASAIVEAAKAGNDLAARRGELHALTDVVQKDLVRLLQVDDEDCLTADPSPVSRRLRL